MLSFSKKSHITTGYIDKLMDKTVVIERELEKEFYKLYNETRLMLIKEFEELNNLSRLEAIHYAQRIMNRYMFICFAEDIDLLPAQISTDTILTPILKGNLRHGSIWQRLNELFLDINEGNEYKKISQYNGGIFKENLEKLKIRDIVKDQKFFNDVYQDWKFEEYEEDINTNLGPYGKKVNPIYRNMLTISTFDFSTELDVNILGHIFKNSIGDIEELKESSKGRRKKERIFYTPDYITDYICRNTIIPYLSMNGKAETVAELIQEYSSGQEIETLESKVMNIKIVDPACGSGAFLNKASDILLEIHKLIYDFKKINYTTTIETKGGKGKDKVKRTATHIKLDSYFDEISARRKILIHNIYGVDLNEESVDITKLSLFLKVCQKNRKLPDLEKNIKCGNSLINDPKYTNKPFKWDKEFPEIFQKGGFDVVIGNPPYVRMEKFKEIKPFLKTNYETFDGRSDLYVYFFEKGLNILKDEAMFSFICSDKFVKAKYGKPLRNFILKYSLLKYIDLTTDFTGEKVFEDTTTYPSITVIKKITPTPETKILVNDDFELNQTELNDNVWNFEPSFILNLKKKINSAGIPLKEISNLNIRYGIKTGYNEAFIINQEIRNNLINQDYRNKEIIKPLVRGRDIKPYGINYQNLYIIIIKFGDGNGVQNNFPKVYSYLKNYEEKLKNRGQVKNGQHHWLELDNNPSSEYFNQFEKEKIIWSEIVALPKFTFDEDGLYPEATTFFLTCPDINLKYLTALFNSKLLFWIFKDICTDLRGGYVRYKKVFIEQLPIYIANSEQRKPIIDKISNMLKINKNLIDEINGFKGWLQRDPYNIDKFSKKLDKYYELSYDEFLSELNKKNVDIKSRDTQELLLKEFDKSLVKINPLLLEIKKTNNEINQMV